MRQEEMKTYPLGDVWNYFCELNGAPVQEDWFAEIENNRCAMALKGKAASTHRL